MSGISRSIEDGIYKSFNARNLTPTEVAQSFVAPRHFADLCRSEHTLIMGPRGSGKTTLFKMLTREALDAWTGQQVEEVRESLGFIAVYIPTDVHWHHQLRVGSDGAGGDVGMRLIESAITLNVLHSVCKAFEDFVYHSPARREEELEERAAREILPRWGLSDVVPTFAGIRRAMSARVAELDVVRNRIRGGQRPQEVLDGLEDLFFGDYLTFTRVACEIFDDVYSSFTPAKWGLCFDELELAPSWFQERLFEELRSTHQKFLFKLSTAPVPRGLTRTEAGPKQDYRVVRLWRHSKSGATYSFPEKLTKMVLERRLGQEVSPGRVFGHSPFSQAYGGTDQYETNGEIWETFRSLAEKDVSFRAALCERGIDPEDPVFVEPTMKDRFARKVKPLAILRDFFVRSNDGRESNLRPRKVSSLYSGKEAIYDVADDNPRWLIYIVGELAERMEIGASEKPLKLDRNAQARVLESASRTYLALLNTLPDARIDHDGTKVDLLEVLDAIGNYFKTVFLREPFMLDPPGSFVVGEDASEAMRRLLQRAVYEGAIVLVNPSEGTVNLDVTSLRFRLSYLLAPFFSLPLRLYSSVRLASALEGGREGSEESIQSELELV